jgi:3-oxoacyl-[acyl-carrier-protein] synthase-3
MISVEIVGTGSYLPGDPISNEQLASVFGRQVVWLSEMLGAKYRYFAVDLDRMDLRSGESNANMATKAAQNAITDAGIDPMSIDLIVMATSTPDYPFPATVLFVQENLGIPVCSVMELRAGCGGMAQAFTIATNLIANGVSKNALLIGSELISPYISLFANSKEIAKDYYVSLSMFGDGAGAVILSATTERKGVIDCFSRSMSTGRAPGMILRTGGALSQLGSNASGKHKEEVFRHDFKAIIAQGPELIKAATNWLVDEKKLSLSKITYFIPPQVNARLINIVTKQMGVREENVFSNFERVGNTVSASIYIALDQMNKEKILKQGDVIVLLPSEGTKWLYGAVVLQWTKGNR